MNQAENDYNKFIDKLTAERDQLKAKLAVAEKERDDARADIEAAKEVVDSFKINLFEQAKELERARYLLKNARSCLKNYEGTFEGNTILQIEAFLKSPAAPKVLADSEYLTPSSEDWIEKKSQAIFVKELEDLINRYSLENGSNTPDFILAEYLANSLAVFNRAVQQRETWYGRRDVRPSTMISHPAKEAEKGEE